MHLTYAVLITMFVVTPVFAQYPTPKISDPRLTVELVAAAPDIVHPIACDFDSKGRLLVIESHTHFAPKDYKGPKFDRIRMLDPSLGARAPISTFFEGTRHTMDLAVHPDGPVYLATRNEILRLRESPRPPGEGQGVKVTSERIVFLDTKGDYPHNGLSGLCFDSKGDLYFGMGENLGAKYTISGSDGVKFSGEGDGGHIFHCTADGKKLRKVATGFWNPFGICRDIYGRVFAVDNDPDQSPPCRMVHVVEGGDYGFRFMYGRSGKHPFQSWHGELPGTLPMMTGVGEAPCEILSYESDGLPAEYRGQLLVTSWADHRVERYVVKPHGASFKAERLPFIQGGQDFRPVGLCVAPDGSLYFTDWVKRDYNLHGHGAIWHVKWKDDPTSRERKRPADPKEAIFSMDRKTREAAAKKLASDKGGREFLRSQSRHAERRVRATIIATLLDADDGPFVIGVDRMRIIDNDPETGVREVALRDFAPEKYTDSKYPASLRAIVFRNTFFAGTPFQKALVDDDPFLRHAAITSRAIASLLGNLNRKNPRLRESLLLAIRSIPEFNKKGDTVWPDLYLDDDVEVIRFLSVKHISDEKLADYRPDIEKLMADPKLSVRMYLACATALARLDGKEVNEKSLADYFAKRLVDPQTPAAQAAMLLRQVPVTHKAMTVELLAKFAKSEDAALKMEAVRALVEHPNPKKSAPLLDVFRSQGSSNALRGFALAGLENIDPIRDQLMALAKDGGSPLGIDALRALNGERGIEKDRPPAKDLDAWMKRLEGKADADAGARVFAHPKLANCARCHRIDGRGADVGPDLSNIGNTDRRHLLESILQPSNTVAPHYVAWHLETADGKVRTGMLIDTNLDVYTYVDSKGERFKVVTRDLVEQRPLSISIMPDGLEAMMTDQELRDLLAYLQARK